MNGSGGPSVERGDRRRKVRTAPAVSDDVRSPVWWRERVGEKRESELSVGDGGACEASEASVECKKKKVQGSCRTSRKKTTEDARVIVVGTGRRHGKLQQGRHTRDRTKDFKTRPEDEGGGRGVEVGQREQWRK
jgi:hypothetical protein